VAELLGEEELKKTKEENKQAKKQKKKQQKKKKQKKQNNGEKKGGEGAEGERQQQEEKAEEKAGEEEEQQHEEKKEQEKKEEEKGEGQGWQQEQQQEDQEEEKENEQKRQKNEKARHEEQGKECQIQQEEADTAVALSLDVGLQLAINAATADNIHELEAAIERAKRQAHDQEFSVRRLKLLKPAKRMLKQLTQTALEAEAVPMPAPSAADAAALAPAPQVVQPLPPAIAAFKSRTTLGSLTYDQNDVLGEGSLGTKVYRGRHHDGREVAVKVMKKGVVPEHRAEREMQLLQTLAEGEGRGRQHVCQYRVGVQNVLLLYGCSIYETSCCIKYGV
jgi:hypothetical protein